jgi:AraC-like DNA-binding protein
MLEKLLSNLSLDVQPFALCMLDSGWRLRLPAPPMVLIHFVLQGRGTLRGPDGRASRLAPMSMAIIPAGSAHVLEVDGEVLNELEIDAPPKGPPIHQIVAGTSDHHELVVACGMVNARFGESIGLFDHLHNVLTVDLSDVPHVADLFEGILIEQSQTSPGSKVLLAALMTQLFVHMFRRLAYGTDRPLPWLTALEDPRLARAIDSVFDDPAENHSVESLASYASMSRSAFAEHFTASFGRSPMNFVNHVRMERAARLLQAGSLSVEQVTNKVGYLSRSHFSQAFKKHTGHSPADYRHEVDPLV